MIIFVFDPLAIALVVAANMAFAMQKPRIKMSVPEGMEFNTPYPIDLEEPIEPTLNNQELEGTDPDIYGEDRTHMVKDEKGVYRPMKVKKNI